jgi:hypothetical protein
VSPLKDVGYDIANHGKFTPITAPFRTFVLQLNSTACLPACSKTEGKCRYTRLAGSSVKQCPAGRVLFVRRPGPLASSARVHETVQGRREAVGTAKQRGCPAEPLRPIK